MPITRRRVDLGAARGRELVARSGREILDARTNAGLSQDAVSSAAGLSRAQYGRIERGVAPQVSIASLARISTALGLELSVRFYPVADPVRDDAQRRLLEQLRGGLHPSLGMPTEVTFSRPGDLRAWDAVIDGLRGPDERQRSRCAVEAETRPTDVQALERKLALKQRDGGIERLVLVLPDTRHNRAFLYGPGATLRLRFPGDGRRTLELLAAGIAPPANAIILLRAGRR